MARQAAASPHRTRRDALRTRRRVQVGALAAAAVFAMLALGAVASGGTVRPAAVPTPPPPPPPQAGAGADAGGGYQPFPKAIAQSLSSVHTITADDGQDQAQSSQEGGQAPAAPPAELRLLATIGSEDALTAIIRRGATQVVLAAGERADDIEALEVSRRSAIVRYQGARRELTLDAPTLLVSDIGAPAGGSVSASVVTGTSADGMTRTQAGASQNNGNRPPSAFQQRQTGGRQIPPGGTRRGDEDEREREREGRRPRGGGAPSNGGNSL